MTQDTTPAGVFGFTNVTVELHSHLLCRVTSGGHQVMLADLRNISKTGIHSCPYTPLTAGPSPDSKLYCAASPSSTLPVAA